MHILYIEDEPNDANLVERFVRSTPHRMTLVNNLADARNALGTHPDLILVDVIIGQSRQGYLFVREAREGGYAQPIIAVTGLSLPTDIQACLDVGCNEIITKPYMIGQLAETIRKYDPS